MQLSRRTTASAGMLGSLNALAGCARAPSFNIVGSFFPAWLICMVVGIGLATIANWVLRRYKLDQQIVWTIVVYPCLAAFFAFTLWLVFFS
ncbi:MAG TPA: YtcA family lipoprotein [Granulicella sp.]